mmetsp:Transcript_18348/g.54876  ORF Transcript_18348/g.54876 Transcript_18348/m.54876 type:complete len:207 (-) Transcript_18348:69-689(-)
MWRRDPRMRRHDPHWEERGSAGWGRRTRHWGLPQSSALRQLVSRGEAGRGEGGWMALDSQCARARRCGAGTRGRGGKAHGWGHGRADGRAARSAGARGRRRARLRGRGHSTNSMAFMEALLGTGDTRRQRGGGARCDDELAACPEGQHAKGWCALRRRRHQVTESRKPKAGSRKPEAGVEPAIAGAIVARFATRPQLRHKEVVAKS